ncbi:putative PEP-binding protein [Amaricoccus sp.]|uniref:putative PEP-binding protein n=1 Tax=Amaricoccus sp. TaxID=1872485 RepID=UPI001B480D6B|nr:putative PEP-binding protein [Amaricoccus sp.]MBP7000139.1 pyruvate, phosphate dikinase [Amaricoccus sp.]
MKPLDIAPAPLDAVVSLDAGDKVRDTIYGRRAHKLARMRALGLPVLPGLALSFDCVRELAEGGPMPALPVSFDDGRLYVLRSSPLSRSWGGAPAILDVGLGAATLPAVAARIGERRALAAMCGFVQAYAVSVAKLDPEDFEALGAGHDGRPVAGLAESEIASLLAAKKRLYEEETGAPFPEDPLDQLEGAARAMARAWNGASARILREARGAPADAGLGLIVQERARRGGDGLEGTGSVQTVDSRTGAPALVGQFLAAGGAGRPVPIAGEPEALEALAPQAVAALRSAAASASAGMGEAYQFDFGLGGGRVVIHDAVPVRRGARASVRIAVDLADAGAITRSEALLRVDPRNLVEHLHPQIDPAARRDVCATGLGASPGAATGRLVLTPEAAQAAAAQGEATILARAETTPEDIRGMHAARGVLTVRGGMTSHAAVIARGLGVPCVVGAADLRIDEAAGMITTPDGRVLREGALITIDGARGQVIAGAPAMIAAEIGGALSELLDWADAARDLGVRGNADTPAEARMARDFRADGLGLCRTEHMFFEEGRITAMREMILAETPAERRAALDRLLPMQRDDFRELFRIMHGLPVTIRLLDPPLHEFLPHGGEELAAVAAAMGLPEATIRARAEALAEVNPMLGMRGVRLGVVLPEIYEMQARAIFEAAIEVNRDDAADPVTPEVMIPLVSANREVELVKARIDAIAADVQREQGATLPYKLGVMVETPRAALRAGDLAASSAFLSFGTNDLTQMTYGLSRDDAGRFMRDYVNRGVFHEDPFHVLDVEGVGELMLIAARRGRERNPDLTLGLCGEHGGDPSSVRFCKVAGFDYVSCSPYRVPIARLAAAQATILAHREADASL